MRSDQCRVKKWQEDAPQCEARREYEIGSGAVAMSKNTSTRVVRGGADVCGAMASHDVSCVVRGGVV
eukprot:6214831-Pleurochrysis_carterae.AAC.2